MRRASPAEVDGAPRLDAAVITAEGLRGIRIFAALPQDALAHLTRAVRDVAVAAGLTVRPERSHYDVVILGGGPAGITAAVNGAAEGLRTVVIEAIDAARHEVRLDGGDVLTAAAVLVATGVE